MSEQVEGHGNDETALNAQLRKKAARLRTEEVAAGKLEWYWLSFAGEDGFLGGIVLQGYGPLDAVARSHESQQNPGGEVAILPLGVEDLDTPAEWKNRLLSKEEMEKLGMEPFRMADNALHQVDSLCQEHNKYERLPPRT